MAPKAEIHVPRGITPEEHPINISDVSSSSLARFLEKQNPDLSFDREPNYIKIFERIRPLTQHEQKKLLVGFYTEGVKDFPNGKALGEFLARVNNNIAWIKPKETPDQSLLEKLGQQHLSCLNLPSSPVRLIKENWGKVNAVLVDAARANWGTAWDAAWSVARDMALGKAARAADDAARVVARGAADDAAWGAARDVAREGNWDAAWSKTRKVAEEAVRDAAWIIVEDLMPKYGYKGNPYEPLIKIYEMGCWPIGVVKNPQGKNEFVIFIPPVQKTS